MTPDKLIDQAISNCPYLLMIQIGRDETLKKDVKNWLRQIIKDALELP